MNNSNSEVEKLKKSRDRLRIMFDIVHRWLDMRQRGIKLEKFFVDNNYNNVAIYGAADLGKLLKNELNNSEDVTVRCFFDRKLAGQSIELGAPVLRPEEVRDINDIDIIVISVATNIEEIISLLTDLRLDIPAVPLTMILDLIDNEDWYEQHFG